MSSPQPTCIRPASILKGILTLYPGRDRALTGLGMAEFLDDFATVLALDLIGDVQERNRCCGNALLPIGEIKWNNRDILTLDLLPYIHRSSATAGECGYACPCRNLF